LVAIFRQCFSLTCSNIHFIKCCFIKEIRRLAKKSHPPPPPTRSTDGKKSIVWPYGIKKLRSKRNPRL
jgi:hypothetical protein